MAVPSPGKRLLLMSSSRTHGSGYLDHGEVEIRRLLGNLKRVLFVPFALADHSAYSDRVRERLERMQLGLDSLHDASNPIAAVERAEAILVGGGNTFRLLDALYRHRLLEPIRAGAEGGLPYLGWSAGANVACPSLMTTNDMPIVQPPSFKALSLVPFNINPHYLDPDPASTHMGETREQRILEFHEMNDPVVVGLREGAMIDIEGPRATLRGTSSARIFRKRHPPEEWEIGSNLDFLLAPL